MTLKPGDVVVVKNPDGVQRMAKYLRLDGAGNRVFQFIGRTGARGEYLCYPRILKPGGEEVAWMAAPAERDAFLAREKRLTARPLPARS